MKVYRIENRIDIARRGGGGGEAEEEEEGIQKNKDLRPLIDKISSLFQHDM